MSKPARLPNNELEFLERTIGASLTIISRCKNLAYLTDDPEELEIILTILKNAQFIRSATITWLDNRKESKRV